MKNQFNFHMLQNVAFIGLLLLLILATGCKKNKLVNNSPDGIWNLVHIGGGWNVSKTYNPGESQWHFNSAKNILTIINTVPTDPIMFFETGNYLISVDPINEKIDLGGITPSYRLRDNNQTLVLDFGVSVDNQAFIFERVY